MFVVFFKTRCKDLTVSVSFFLIHIHCAAIAPASLDFHLMKCSNYLAAQGCSNNALNLSFTNIYFSNPLFSDKCRCGLLHVFQRKSSSPFKTSSKRVNKINKKKCQSGNCYPVCGALSSLSHNLCQKL